MTSESVPGGKRVSDRHRLDIDPTRTCRVDVKSMAIPGPLLSAINRGSLMAADGWRCQGPYRNRRRCETTSLLTISLSLWRLFTIPYTRPYNNILHWSPSFDDSHYLKFWHWFLWVDLISAHNIAHQVIADGHDGWRVSLLDWCPWKMLWLGPCLLVDVVFLFLMLCFVNDCCFNPLSIIHVISCP